MDSIKDKILFWTRHGGDAITLGQLQKHIGSSTNAQERKKAIDELIEDGFLFLRPQLRQAPGRVPMAIGLTPKAKKYLMDLETSGTLVIND